MTKNNGRRSWAKAKKKEKLVQVYIFQKNEHGSLFDDLSLEESHSCHNFYQSSTLSQLLELKFGLDAEDDCKFKRNSVISKIFI